MKIKYLLTFSFLYVAFLACAQDADQIISDYFKNTGGLDTWKDLQTMKIMLKLDQGQMQMNGVIYRKKPHFQRTEVMVQGSTIVQAYDGTTAWFINPMMGSNDPQKMPPEMTNSMKADKFESDLLDYKEKGHAVLFEGMETVGGVETYKIKLTKKGGDVEHYYFDKEKMVPVMNSKTIQAGPAKGMTAETHMSDYREVGGLMMPFAMEVKANGQTMQKMIIEDYVLNEEMDDTLFSFPGEE